MTPEELRTLAAKGPTLDVAFVSDDRRERTDAELAEAVVCLANRAGDRPGWLFVGVEDDGRISGARFRHHHRTDPARVATAIAHATRPALAARVSVVCVDGKDVVAIEVPSARTPVGTTDGTYLRRVVGSDGKPGCMPMHFHEMQTLQADRGLLDHSAQVLVDARFSDLDPLEVERYRRVIRESPGKGDARLAELPDLDLARALGVVSPDGGGVRVAGLLLFGKEEALRTHVPAHEVAFQVLRGTELAVNDFFRWPLLRVAEEIGMRFRAQNRETELLCGLVRVGVPDYPPRAFREALANALIHRDYTRMGAVHVQWHADRIELSNPGGFPEGVGLDNLLVPSPRPRNPLLADCMKRAGIVERSARGIDTIYLELLRSGHPPPEYGRSGNRDVVLVMRGGASNLAWVELVVASERAGGPLSLDDLLVLAAAARTQRLTPDAARGATQGDAGTASAALERLCARGLLARLGADAFALADAHRRALGLPQPDGRLVAGAATGAEDAVLAHVATHGRITRAQAAALHGLGTDQAKRLLASMAERGLIARKGDGRGAYYEAPAATPEA